MQIYPDEVKGYKFCEIIGKGTYGVVCKYSKNGSLVAIKFEEISNNI